MKVFLAFLKAQFLALGKSIRMIVQSRTVQSCAAGLGVHFAVKRGWLPDNFVTSAVETLTYILAALFRVKATENIDPSNPAKTLTQ